MQFLSGYRFPFIYYNAGMRKAFLIVVGLCVFLSAREALAFFGILDQLKEELAGIEDQESASVRFDDLIDELSQGMGQKFSDIAGGAWYERYVQNVAEWGIVSGYKDAEGRSLGRYGPGDPVTIAQMLKIALEAAQIDEKQCGSLPQHPQAQNHWAAQYIACGEQKGMRILRTFPNIDRPALRGEVLVIIHDAFGDRVPPLLSTFRDVADHPYEADIAYAAALHVVSGDTDSAGQPIGTFRPNDQVNRAEAAKIIYEKLKAEVIVKG